MLAELVSLALAAGSAVAAPVKFAGAVVPGSPDFPSVQASAKFERVVIISVDGMHQNDLTRQVAAYPNGAFAALVKNGIEFTNATTSSPSDSFPGSAAYSTGASPRTTGIYYDVSYANDLYPPGSNCTGPLGSPATFDETLDLNNTMLDGGGGLDPTQLSMRMTEFGTCVPVYPNNFIRVNTIFEVARFAGYNTAWSDKHPAYSYLNGPSGLGLADSYFPEVASVPGTVAATESYDALHWSAIGNWTKGEYYNGTKWSTGGPALYGCDLQTVSVAQKTYGYIDSGSKFSANLSAAIQTVDKKLGAFIQTMKDAGTYEKTLLIVTAKHGQSAEDASLLKRIDPTALVNATGVNVPGVSADDGAYLWLQDKSQAATAKANLLKNASSLGIETVWIGNDIVANGFGDPVNDPRTPDLVIKTKPGIIFTSPKATKIEEHGGINKDDVDVLLVAHNPSFSGKTCSTHVSTRQIAATAVEALGLDSLLLEGVRAESTEVLPSVFK